MNNSLDPHENDTMDFWPQLRRHLAGDVHALTDLPERERALAQALAPIIESVRRLSDIPPADEPALAVPPATDPIAIALGLVAGPEDRLDSRRFKASRQSSGQDIKSVADRLVQRGWAVTTNQVLRWQQQDTALAPALINAIAQTIGVPPDGLRARLTRPRTANAADYLDDERIASFIAEWALEIHRSPENVRSRVARTLTSMNYRNEDVVTVEDVLRVLQALRRIDPGNTAEEPK